jgi:hypothetical protein
MTKAHRHRVRAVLRVVRSEQVTASHDRNGTLPRYGHFQTDSRTDLPEMIIVFNLLTVEARADREAQAHIPVRVHVSVASANLKEWPRFP